MEQPFYLAKLRQDLSKRQRTNPSYSLRAYARDLGIPASTMSQVLLGNRPLPFKNFDQVISGIRLNSRERTLFFDSLGKKHLKLDQIQVPTKDSRFILDETHHQIIAEWEHYAVLMLFDCDGFERTESSVVKRLGITPLRAQVVIQNLINAGMLTQDASKKLNRCYPKFRTTEDVLSQALRASHRESLDMAQKKIESIEIELRDFSSMMIALDVEKIPEVKVAIREFRQKISSLLENGKRSEVYQIAIQFYPVTKMKLKSKKPQNPSKGRLRC